MGGTTDATAPQPPAAAGRAAQPRRQAGWHSAPRPWAAPARGRPRRIPRRTSTSARPFTKANLRYNPTSELIFPCIRGVYDKISQSRWAGTTSTTRRTTRPAGSASPTATPSAASSPSTRTTRSSRNAGRRTTRSATSRRRTSSGTPRREVLPVLPRREHHHPDGLVHRRRPLHLLRHGAAHRRDPGLDRDVLRPGLRAPRARAWATSTSWSSWASPRAPGKIFWGWSTDGKTWQFDPTPLVSPGPDGQTDIAAPHLLKRNNTAVRRLPRQRRRHVHHRGRQQLRPGDPPRRLPRRDGRRPRQRPQRRAPRFGTDGGVEYMFYEAGQRGSTRIAVARAV